MREDTKLNEIREAMRAGDWDQALKLAAKFRRLGEHEDAIRQSAAALASPRIYEAMGHDIEALRSAGVAALKARFSKSWEEVQPARDKHAEKQKGNDQDAQGDVCGGT